MFVYSNRKLALLLLVFLATVAILVACSQTATEVPPATDVPPVTDAPAATKAPAAADPPPESAGVCPKEGGTLTIVQGISPTNLDIYTSDPGAEGIFILQQVQEGLLRYDEQSNVVPALAKEWSISEDGLTYNFKLHEGVKFHSGQDFTAEDVVYSFGRMMDPEIEPFGGRRHRTYVDKVEAVNDYEVNIILKQPWPPYPVFLATYMSFITDQECVEEAGDDFGFSAVCGTGPYMFKDWIRDDHLTIEKNPNYWQEGLPCTDEIVYRVITDPGVIKINLETDAVNALQDPPMELIADFEANPDIKVQSAPDSAVYYLVISTGKPPFDDVDVRRALTQAVDRQEVADLIFAGFAEPSTGFFPSYFWAHNPDFEIPYDPEGAKAMLAEAGYDEGNPLQFTLHVYNSPPYTDIGQLIQAQFKNIGVEVEVIPLDKASVLDLARGVNDENRTEMGMILLRSIPYNVSDDWVAGKWATWGPHNSITRYNSLDGVQNPKAEEMLKELVVLSDYVEADRAIAMPIYNELEQMVLLEDAAMIQLVVQENLDVVRAEVMDWPTSVDDEVPYYRVWIDQ